mmetsp:Transcript_6945/g.19661  ORF Transcript_6945/g.19661 Transcript_6945/m.19661 type:complete len:451 (+) Transcript_6945:119-1471(+)|eukprot:CAMPEP_0119129490 /NCGR_PEP_ID=MMETSP1310-20130426/7211_1 /TAXON_ID=464262 /ORGANISM="Genus nov. species nov., Strain RCC2339" /LENGTH=450 /DNA_ID=CAMNT_0007119911 /DNA_START=113 /DNA_END=1465 /DNA_ORIENTATION=+
MGGPLLPPLGCDTADGLPDSGDTAWMMAATTLVFLQTPAIGILQAGLIRRENSLSMLLQAMCGVAIGSILWVIWGFSLTFGEDHGGFIGDVYYAMFVNLDPQRCYADAPTISAPLYAMFQMTFAIMVPVIITGSWAEKLNFRAFVLFVTIWPHFVYYPLAHWVWGGGWLSDIHDGEGVIDFAGGITVHTCAGTAAFVVALVMGRRLGKDNIQDVHHNIPLTIVGGMLIWGGWFGFNGGSSFAADSVGSLAMVNTHVAASTAAFTWGLLAFIEDSHYHLGEFMNGAYCGLAAVTPGAGFVLTYSAFAIGIVAAVAGFFSVRLLKNVMKVDDVLDVASLQGTPGILGTFLAGFLATEESGNGVDGCFYGDCILVAYQCVGIVVAIIWTALWTFIIMKLLDLTVGIYISIDLDEEGLDKEVGEQAYDNEGAAVGGYRGISGFGVNPIQPKYRK